MQDHQYLNSLFRILFVMKEVSVMNTFIHQNGRLTDRDNIYNRLETYYE